MFLKFLVLGVRKYGRNLCQFSFSIIVCYNCNYYCIGRDGGKVLFEYFILITGNRKCINNLNLQVSLAELIFRANFHAYCLFSLVNTIVYCIPAGWLWNTNGFLKQLGVVDIAGSGGVHLIGGSSGIFNIY